MAIVCPLQNFLLPYVQQSVLLVLCGHGKSGREAERSLEPSPMGLPWDYQAHVTVPFCCGLTLFIMSPSIWWTHIYLCTWCVVFYCFQRFMHLRVCKKSFFTSNKLDCVVLYLGWGLLLAELAACHAYWRVQRLEWPWWTILVATAVSYAVYWPLLQFVVGVPFFGQGRAPSLATADDRTLRASHTGPAESNQLWQEVCYDWFNVNPIHVLKSQYCEELFDDQQPVVFYDAGKEYLQLNPGGAEGPETPRSYWNHRRGQWSSVELELEGLGFGTPDPRGLIAGRNGLPASEGL